MDVQRATIPFSQSQTVMLNFCSTPREVEKWLDSLVEVKGDPDVGEYYLHIDHLQVLTPPKGTGYSVIAVYHRVYVQRGL